MDKLANYGSDDDYEDSPKQRKTGTANDTDGRSEREQAQVDANYEEVYMELSEDSASSNSSRSTPERASRDIRGKSPKRDNRAPPVPSRRDEDSKYRSRGDDRRDSKDDRRDFKDDRREPKDDRRDSKDDRRDLKDDRREPKEDRRDDRRGDTKERYRSRDDRYKDRHRDERNSRDSRDRYRDDRRSKRSTSRERRSRSPRRAEHRNRRSNSRDRDNRDGRDSRPSYGRKYERYAGAKGVFEKQEAQKPQPVEEQKPKQDADGNRFFMPGITGRFRDQIERRKLLWQKKDKDAVEKPVAAPSTSTGKVWQTTTFAQDTDGKVASKFKRLMGIREPGGDGQKPEGDILKKQEEMFSSMEQQYEVARTATHTMRGVGLGFGSFQR